MLGLIARADNSGLGVQSWEFARNMHPDRVLVIDVSHLHDDTDHSNKRTDLSRFPGALVSNGWIPNTSTIEQFCDGLDVIFTCETTYSPELITIAHRRGVKVVNQYNHEFLSHALYNFPHPDVFAAPSRWMWDAIDVPNRIHLPVPIATDRWTVKDPAPTARNFLHVVGRPAAYDRNGTPDLLAALPFVSAEITLTLTCQDVAYLTRLLHTRIPDNVEIVVRSGDANHYWDLYDSQDVLILPRRFGGLCLPAQEAIGAGMPVMMTDVSPNDDWLPSEWLVPAVAHERFSATTDIDVHHADPQALATLIDRFATDEQFYSESCADAAQIREELSWTSLKPHYDEVVTCSSVSSAT